MNRHDKQILESLTLSDFTGKDRQIAEAIGIEGLIRLSEIFGGSDIYIPQKKELIKNRVYQLIYEEFDGTNVRELTAKYHISKTTIYNIVREKMNKKKSSSNKILSGQLTVADLNL